VVVSYVNFVDLVWHAAIRSGDYFGLDMLLSIPSAVVVRILVDHPPEYFENLIVEVSDDGEYWVC
jgi:hypothetical protein